MRKVGELTSLTRRMTRQGATSQQILEAAIASGIDASNKQIENVRYRMRLRERVLRQRRASQADKPASSGPKTVKLSGVDPEHVKLVLRHGLTYFHQVISVAERRVENLI